MFCVKHPSVSETEFFSEKTLFIRFFITIAPLRIPYSSRCFLSHPSRSETLNSFQRGLVLRNFLPDHLQDTLGIIISRVKFRTD